MFQCAHGHTSKPKEKQVRVVAQTRPKTYYETREGKRVVVGTGHETVTELVMCQEHARTQANG